MPQENPYARVKESVPLAVEQKPGDDLQRAASTHFEKPIVAERFITATDGTIYGRIVTSETVPHTTQCWYCGKSEQPELMYQPCKCTTSIHRHCFRQWRTGWINPRNYFSCPNCMFSYNIERVKPATTESKERILQRYRWSIIRVWAIMFLLLGVLIGFFATISYYADTSEKNVPVAMKYMLSSVVQGFPNENSTEIWRSQFKLPNYAVWPYYTLLGVLCTSVLILIGFAFMGCTFDENERKRQDCCNCCSDACDGANCYYCYCYDPCPHCSCGSCDSCGNCGSGDCGGGSDCKGGGEAVIILVLVIAVIVVLSAVFVVIIFCVKKISLLYDRVSDMLQTQQSELEGETVVLGIYESWRPNDSV